MLSVRAKLAVFALILTALVACGRPPLQQSDWEKDTTLWRGAEGAQFALYHIPTALSKDPEAYGCETRINGRVYRKQVPISEDTFPMVVGDTAYIFNLRNNTMPGWYRLKRNHNLTWWQRNIYTAESLGGWSAVNPAPLELQNTESLRGGVYLLEGSELRKVADESRIPSLWEVPAEGTLYVADPGIGVVNTLDLRSLCR